MKKVILKVNAHDGKAKMKIMKAISKIPAIESMSFDLKEQKLTVIGGIDPVEVVEKLRSKGFNAEIVSVGPKDEKKDDKKDDGKKEYENLLKAYEEYCKKNPCYPNYNYYPPTYYNVMAHDDGPNSCVIC